MAMNWGNDDFERRLQDELEKERLDNQQFKSFRNAVLILFTVLALTVAFRRLRGPVAPAPQLAIPSSIR